MNNRHLDGYSSEVKTADVVARYLAGESAYSIAKHYNVTTGMIIYRLKKSNIYKGKKACARQEYKRDYGACHKAYKELMDKVEAKEAGSMVEMAEFIVNACKGCPFMKESCTFKQE